MCCCTRFLPGSGIGARGHPWLWGPLRSSVLPPPAGVTVVWWCLVAVLAPGMLGGRESSAWGAQHRDNAGAAPRAPGCSGRCCPQGWSHLEAGQSHRAGPNPAVPWAGHIYPCDQSRAPLGSLWVTLKGKGTNRLNFQKLLGSGSAAAPPGALGHSR